MTKTPINTNKTPMMSGQPPLNTNLDLTNQWIWLDLEARLTLLEREGRACLKGEIRVP